MPDAVPRAEALSKRGNPAFYEVMGQRYFVMSSASGYVERGIASWYGPGFHQEFTSNGEPYDMYGMTAAHKTLPLPSYVQVTNLSNGKRVILRVNDRGPFKAGRIIDLSYTAAAKLDVLRAGTALVEVRAITLGDSVNANPTDKIKSEVKPMYVQVGSFATASNAGKLAEQLRNQGYAQTAVHSTMTNGHSLYRVRIGPLASVDSFDQVVAQLRSQGFADARIASD
jgi:rare lipoprotein A